MLYAFDLDGTLVDTKAAVLRAYRAVGVEPPEDFFGKPWREWLQDEDRHDAKNLIYAKNVGLWTKRLPLLRVFEDVRKEKAFQHRSENANRVYILTGASLEAAEALMKHHFGYPTPDYGDVYVELTMEQKANRLTHILDLQINAGQTGFYFDDNEETCNYVRENTKWTALHVRY